MTALSTADRTRLVKLLGLLGSDHAGERDNAALAATRLMRQCKLQWSDVIADHATALPRPKPSQNWRDIAQACASRRALLRPWEVQFVHGILQQQSLSRKQSACLHDIAERLGVAGVSS